jgi:O-acetyl-ADP-ribose deacetylase (regulator of RNase III)
MRVKGNLISLAHKGNFDIIAHGCNCWCTMGAGIAKTIKEEFPEAFEADLKTKKGDIKKFGSLSYARVKTKSGKDLIVANLYTQYSLGGPKEGETKEQRLEAIKKSFKELKMLFPKETKNIGVPMLGAGIAGGDWEKIEEAIISIIPIENITVVEFDNSKKNELNLSPTL